MSARIRKKEIAKKLAQRMNASSETAEKWIDTFMETLYTTNVQARARRPMRNGMIMKKISNYKKDATIIRELRPEYYFDYRKAKPNRFAGQIEEDRVVVVLDPDVSEVFQTADSVNELLRALIKTMPPSPKRSESKSRRPRTSP